MTTLVILQIILPLVLLAGLALRPARSWVGLSLQVLATASVLAALHLSGLWMMPPWWAVWLYWLLFAAALLLLWRRGPTRSMPRGLLGWAAAAMFAALTAYGAWTALQAFIGRQTPSGPKVELRFPLQQGTYLVVNGGTNVSVSSHALTFAPETPRQRSYYGQSHAVDIVALLRSGLPARGFSPAKPERYEIFGHAILAPCDGVVVQAVNETPDMRVPIMDKANMVGNHVLLRCASADILLAHFRKGSLKVKPGQRVVAGDMLGEAGNSGNSGAPHLHIHAQQPGPPEAPFSGRPLPMTFGGRYLVRGDRIRTRE